MPQKQSFETVYKQLEETVRRLEEGGLNLDESIGLYEEGMNLARACEELLERAELRIVKLHEAFVAPNDGQNGLEGDEQ